MKHPKRKSLELNKRDLGMVKTLMKRYAISKGEAITMHIRSGL